MDHKCVTKEWLTKKSDVIYYIMYTLNFSLIFNNPEDKSLLGEWAVKTLWIL
jgi:hypothetical protein